LHYLGASIAAALLYRQRPDILAAEATVRATADEAGATAALFESMGNPPVAQQNNLSSLSRQLAAAR
jgi:hypothetical protein